MGSSQREVQQRQKAKASRDDVVVVGVIPEDARLEFVRLCCAEKNTALSNFCGKEKEEEANHTTKKKKKTWIPYGTAGFRCDETAMDPIAFRCGFIAACVAAFSSKSSRKRTRASGVVVTASHNHAKDNGVKLVDGEGNVLGERYEGACEALCNATTAKELHDALDAFEEAIVEDQGNNGAEVKEEEEEEDEEEVRSRRIRRRRRRRRSRSRSRRSKK